MLRTLTTAEKTTQLMATKIEYPEKYGWWISELNSLGVNTEALGTGGVQAIENLTDDVKQSFIHEYKPVTMKNNGRSMTI
jgi:hypothetical protein